MPLKTIIIIFALVGISSLIKPDWTMFFIWGGGMALLWVMTGQWVPPAQQKKEETSDVLTPSSEQIRPMEDAIEADDIDDLSRLDGIHPEEEPTEAKK